MATYAQRRWIENLAQGKGCCRYSEGSQENGGQNWASPVGGDLVQSVTLSEHAAFAS